MAKIKNDKYYTSPELAKYVVDKTKEIIGEDNITEYIEPSAGAGVFLDYLDKPYLAYDIEPEDDRIIRQDYLELNLEYKKGRCIIGNPPFGRNMNLARQFYKKSIKIADYIAFILPISQLNNSNSLYEFDLIYSENLGKQIYTDRELHCCFNIYRMPSDGKLNKKPSSKLKDVTIVRQDSKRYEQIKDYDIRMCYWGDGTAGKILSEGESYSGEYKIIINNEERRDEIKDFIEKFDWNGYVKGIAMKRLKQYQIVDILRKHVPGIK